MSINTFLNNIGAKGGMSFTNNFVVKFVNCPITLPTAEGAEFFEMFCNEAQLPNVGTAQGQMNGIYVGSGQVSYPHTRTFTEIQLGFLCDANLTALKFLQDWVDFIFSGEHNEVGSNKSGYDLASMQAVSDTSGSGREENRSVRLKFRDDYACTMAITKTEMGGNSTTERAPITYVLEKAYPYSIDAVPLQFGNSQLTQVTAQFSYMRHYVIKNDITNHTKWAKDADGTTTGTSILAPGPAGDF